MTDPAHEYTDEEIRRVERRLAREYKQAGAEIQTKMEKYLERSAKNDEKKRQQVEDGTLTQEEYNSWRYGQTMVGQRWKEMRDNLAVDYHNANLRAKGITDQSLPRVYAENFNYGTFIGEKKTKTMTAFTLYNEDTVKRLARENPNLLPEREPPPESKDVKWNRQKITSAILQGILQGEPITKVAERLQTVTNMNEGAAYRNARTMMTSAQNAGRMDSLYRIREKTGIPIKKQWLSTLDGRTRHSHRMLDGEIVELDDEFSNKLQYPADPNGAPAEVYNCRCTVVVKIEGLENDDLTDMSQRNTDHLEMEYEDWKRALAKKEKAGKIADAVVGAIVKPYSNEKLEKSLGTEDFKELQELLQESPTRQLYDTYINDWEGEFVKKKKGKYYWDDTKIDYATDKDVGKHKLSTFAHECGHLFDYHIGKQDGLTFKEIDAINAAIPKEFDGMKCIHETASHSDQFLSALREDMFTTYSLYKDKTLVRDIYDSPDGLRFGDDYETNYNASHGVQDALDGFYGITNDGIFGWGHGDKYYDRKYVQIKKSGSSRELMNALKGQGFAVSNEDGVKSVTRQYEAACEAWANIASAETVGGKELEYVKKYMPNAHRVFLEIVGKER